MRTDKQRESSRVNGAKSRGPATEEGRQRSSGNALKHGGLALVHPAPGEPDTIYDDADRELQEILRPRNALEADLVRAVAVDLVRAGRITDYLEASTELNLDDLQDEDCVLREELLRLRTSMARWDRWKHLLEYYGVINEEERLQVLRELLLLVDEARGEEDPRLPRSAYHHHEWLTTMITAMEEGRSVIAPQDAKERMTRIVQTQTSALEDRAEALDARILHRRYLREQMLKAIPDEKSLKLAARYQATIDNGLSRRLGFLKELREVSRDMEALSPSESGKKPSLDVP